VRLTSGTRAQPTWDRVEIQWENLALHLRQVAEALDRLEQACNVAAQQRAGDFEALATDLGAANRHLRELEVQVTALISQPDANGIYWIAQQADNERSASDPLLRLSLHAAPLQVGGLVEQHFLRNKESIILTSATLRTAGSFEFLAERLHMEDEQTLAVGSPFDYTASTLLYLPTDVPEPNASGYQHAVERTIVETARATGGRMLVLFTAYNQLKRTHTIVAPQLALDDIVVYEQGGGTSRRQLMENFKSTERAVLLGTRSFWEGVDIVGEALSCLVIVRLPFAVPNDPIFAARSETFDEPFLQYAVPDAILRFRQGFGRLIRSQTDRGVCIVLDRRMLSKNYGQLFIDSLPPCTTVRGPLANIPAQARQWLAVKTS
jgi:DNA polymerase-3 subunit epsilon/ATP-dependent DNA helicase DinG